MQLQQKIDIATLRIESIMKIKIVAGTGLIIILMTFLYLQSNSSVSEQKLSSDNKNVLPDSGGKDVSQVTNRGAFSEEVRSSSQGSNEVAEPFQRSVQSLLAIKQLHRAIAELVSAEKWDELLELANELPYEPKGGLQFLLMEGAKKNAPDYYYSSLFNLGVTLPDNAAIHLIGKSSRSTLEQLHANGLNLEYSHPMLGGVFVAAALADADADVYEFLIESGAPLAELGQPSALKELIEIAVISNRSNNLPIIENLLNYGAVVSSEQLELVKNYSQIRPELYHLLDSYYQRQN